MSVFTLYRDILAELGVQLENTRILDWGCGAGALVSEGRDAGYDVVGCDFDVELGKSPHLSAIDSQTYRLPYADRSIDVIISSQVLEHVMDYDASLIELRRILKPRGAFLHIFPSRWSPVEPHVHVPGATVIRGRAWLLLWALFGVRNQFQRQMNPLARMRANYAYLRAHTNYLSRRRIARYFLRYFGEIRFVEDSSLRHSVNARGRRLASISRAFPFLPRIYSACRARVVFGRHQLPVASSR